MFEVNSSLKYGFPDVFYSKETACIVGDPGLIPGSGRSPGEGNGNPLQYSCLENSMDRGAWRASVHAVQSRIRLSDGARVHRAVKNVTGFPQLTWYVRLLLMLAASTCQEGR